MAIQTNIIEPTPARSEIIGMEPKQLNHIWELWFRKVYDVVSKISIQSPGTFNTTPTSAIPVSGFNYTIDGNRYFFNYNGPGNVKITLQYPASYTTNFSIGSISAGSKELYIPITNKIINEWFFIDVR